MSEIEKYDENTDLFKLMEEVAVLRFKGHSPTEISRIMNMKRAEVMELERRYREVVSQSTEAQDLAKDSLHQLAQHYDRIIKQYYDLLDDLRSEKFSHQVAAQINSALKQIAELEAKRLDFYQKAGLLDGAELGDELALLEEQKDFILGILRNDLCPGCQRHVKDRLRHMPGAGPVEIVEVHDE